MKVLGVFICLLSAAFGLEYCYDSTICSGKEDFSSCTAKYGEFPSIDGELSTFMNAHISHSFKYLLLSSYFKNFERNRVGFEKLYRKLADKAWENAHDLIKYITKRGGTVKFITPPPNFDLPADDLNLKEIESLAVVLDGQKILAKQANEIHRKVTKNVKHIDDKSITEHDAEVGSYLENHFVHEFSERIRDLSGYVNDLSKLMVQKKQSDSSLALYLFDEYLQKVV